MQKLTLYHFPACPYCQKVFRYLEENKIEVETKDIKKEPAAEVELIELGGKKQVPCLIIDGKALYESDDIINWFKNNL